MSLLSLAGITPAKTIDKKVTQQGDALKAAKEAAAGSFRVLVAMPAYGNMLHVDAAQTLIQLVRMGFPADAMFVGNESLITRGRNTCISVFMAKPEYTHLLFLDADISISPMSIVQLVGHTLAPDSEVHAIGAAVALKGFNKEGRPITNVGAPKSSIEAALVEVDRVGTAVLLLTRKACESLCAEAPQYPGNPLSRGDGTSARATHYDVFRVGKEDPTDPQGEYLSEDYYACKTLRENGFKIYIDQMLATLHNGNYPFHNGAV